MRDPKLSSLIFKTMPDITMCKGGDCTMKQTCYRFRATPNEYRQSYFGKPPFKGVDEDGNSECDHYIMKGKLS